MLAKYSEEVRAGCTGGRLLLYVPTSAPLTLHGDYSTRTCTPIDLVTRQETVLPVTYGADGLSHIPQHSGYQDALLILK